MKLLALVLLSLLAVQAADYRVMSGGENSLTLEVEKTGLMKGKKHVFAFPDFEGKLSFDAATLESSKVDLTIKTTGMECRDTWVSDKDRVKILNEAKKEMLKTDQFPEMRYVSNKVTKEGNVFRVDGTLTIRGTGRPAVLEVTMEPSPLAFNGKSQFKMSAYGMKPPSAALGAVGTKDEMIASFHIKPVQ